VCPIDSDGTGADSFMFPVTLTDGVSTLNASALETQDKDIGSLAFRFAFGLTDESLPVPSVEAAPPSLPDLP
ncbi:MAG: hypothetical protein QF464_03560, partial [Myxococcota bacterium]|nr:hypothetical protein [Myxococcota bacterium]